MTQDVDKILEDNPGTAPLQQGRVILDGEGSAFMQSQLLGNDAAAPLGITDGTSNTLVVGETLPGSAVPDALTQGADGPEAIDMAAWHELVILGDVAAAAGGPSSLGDTATHEVGHWMGDEPDDGLSDGLSAIEPDDAAVKEVDRASPLIAKALTRNEVVEGGPTDPATELAVAPGPPEEPAVPADVQYTEANGEDFMQVKLENVQITSYQLGVLDNNAAPGSDAAIPDLMTEGATPEEPAISGDPPSAGGPPVSNPAALFSFNPQPEPPGDPEALENGKPLDDYDESSTLETLGVSAAGKEMIALGEVSGLGDDSEFEDGFEEPEL
jgi:hypothetical protein